VIRNMIVSFGTIVILMSVPIYWLDWFRAAVMTTAGVFFILVGAKTGDNNNTDKE